jgi:hypothetical protein
MSKTPHRLTVALVRPPLLLFGFLAKSLYALLFGWTEKKHTLTKEKQFRQEIEAALPFLFNSYNARFIQSKYSHKSFDYVSATVDIGNLLLAFDRGRGELVIRIAARNSGDWQKWQDMLETIPAMEDPFNVRHRVLLSLDDWALLLKPNMPRLLEVFSGDQYSDTRQYLTAFKRGENPS